ncbi:MAG: 2-amino-4-hydroxy-6-hydroxymethyldihydropteridine diphosphokinase [Endomicrobium sp.]|jgi:2-amino-4-hydroxy-6-hydroxymethyldihydropteridine diphosphokinase|nr:2-amino-4-hydroxy-6-hydroxymethyldihydropteridine diphosphokinase [Endomicrobium sp.]
MKAFLGLGSNIGDRRENIEYALSVLQSSGFVELEALSQIYETSPIGHKQRDFYNMCIQVQTSLSAHNLLFLLKDIEKLLGRKKAKRWAARIIDIDILFYEQKIVKTNTLNIPHKEIENRLFVLKPLSEIAPNLKHPILNRKIKEILQEKLLTLACQKIIIAPQI